MTHMEKNEIRILKGNKFTDRFIDEFDREWTAAVAKFKRKKRKDEIFK